MTFSYDSLAILSICCVTSNARYANFKSVEVCLGSALA